MIGLPRWMTAGPTWLLGAYTAGFALIGIPASTRPATDLIALLLFAGAFAATLPKPLRIRTEIAVDAVCLLLPALVTLGLDPAASYSAGGWHVSAIACLGVRMLLRHRSRSAYLALASLTVQTALWDGVHGLVGFGVVAVDLLVAVGAVCAWGVGRTALEMTRFQEVEQKAAALRAAQDAYHQEREVRLLRVAGGATDMLRRVVAEEGRLDAADRAECRLLEQTIRDENRGRALLNDAVRREVLAARRRGALVQLIDDGGLDALPDDVAEGLRDRLAATIAPLSSSRIVVRATGAAEHVITVVATTPDPVAAALGLDDDETVDLWVTLEATAVA